MDKKLSRRGFIKKSAVALGTVAAGNLTCIIGSEKGGAFKALASEGLKKNNGPHVSVKLFPGRSEQTKQRLADAIAEDVVSIIECDEESVSVTIEDVSASDWKKQVYDPEIKGNMTNLYKKPGYSM